MPKSTPNSCVLVSLLIIGLWLGAAPLWSFPSPNRITPAVQAVGKIMPSVVSVGTNEKQSVLDPYQRWFLEFGPDYGTVPSPGFVTFTQYIPLGSGVVVDASGLILTNYHVVARATNVRVRVRLSSGKEQEFAAITLAHDHINDLCLLELQDLPADVALTAAEFALPKDLLLGETVIAVGNPFGYEHSVTEGILSAKNRSYSPDGNMAFHDILQTDAAINPGNSGGPLINLDGQLIGINVAIRQDAEGIGFAIPLERIEKVLAHWMVPARRTSSILGLVPDTQVVKGTCQATVGIVELQSPAAEAGLEPGMIIESANGVAVRRAIELSPLLFRVQGGDSFQLRLAGGKAVTLEAKPMTDVQLIRRRLGVHVQAVTPALGEALNIPPNLRHTLAISEIYPGSDIASRRNQYGEIIRRGDILVGIRPQKTVPVEETASVKALARMLAGTRGGMDLYLAVYAVENVNGRSFLTPIEIQVSLE